MAAGDPVHARERAFYAGVAGGLDAARMPPRPPDAYERSILEALGDVAGLAVLDAGCGAGDLTLELLGRGARVTALDLSHELLGVARARVQRFAPAAAADGRARFVAAPLEATGLPAGSCDLVAGKWVLHHADVAGAGREVRRLLAPGGRAVFYENQAVDPLLAFARRRLARLPGLHMVGTADEHPLVEADYAALRELFGRVEVDHPHMYFLQALSRSLGHRGLRAAERLDAALWRRAPRLRRHSWHALLTLSGARTLS